MKEFRSHVYYRSLDHAWNTVYVPVVPVLTWRISERVYDRVYDRVRDRAYRHVARWS